MEYIYKWEQHQWKGDNAELTFQVLVTIKNNMEGLSENI